MARKLSEAQIEEVIQRRRAGESLQQISDDLCIYAGLLRKNTAHAFPVPDKIELTPSQIDAIMQRWLAGESIRQLAKAYNVENQMLSRHTQALRDAYPREARKKPFVSSKKQLSKKQIEICLKKWEEGESVEQLAEALRVEEAYLIQLMQQRQLFLKNKKSKKCRIPSAQIEQMMERWKNGEPIIQIAHDYTIPGHLGIGTVLQATRQVRAEYVASHGMEKTRHKTLAGLQNKNSPEPIINMQVMRERLAMGEAYANLVMESGMKEDEFRDLLNSHTLAGLPVTDVQLQTAAGQWPYGKMNRAEDINPKRFPITDAIAALSSEEIATLAMRWNHSEPLSIIAKSIHTHPANLMELLMYVCWEAGISLERIADHFNKGKVVARRAISKFMNSR